MRLDRAFRIERQRIREEFRQWTEEHPVMVNTTSAFVEESVEHGRGDGVV